MTFDGFSRVGDHGPKGCNLLTPGHPCSCTPEDDWFCWLPRFWVAGWPRLAPGYCTTATLGERFLWHVYCSKTEPRHLLVLLVQPREVAKGRAFWAKCSSHLVTGPVDIWWYLLISVVAAMVAPCSTHRPSLGLTSTQQWWGCSRMLKRSCW